jgi:hypothetical protein
MKSIERRAIVNSVNSLVKSLARLLDTMAKVTPTGRAPIVVTDEKRRKLKASIGKYWASLTPAQHKARVAKMLAGRGLKPRSR